MHSDRSKVSQTEDKHTDLADWNCTMSWKSFLSPKWTRVIDNCWCRKWYSREEVSTDTV